MITVNRAKIENSKVLMSIKKSAFEEEIELYGVVPPNFDSLQHQIKTIEGKHYFTILKDETIIGGACVIDKGNDKYELGSLYIDKKHQNKGFGSTALKLINDEFPHAKKWTLETPFRSYRNHHFYEKHGYKKIHEYSPKALFPIHFILHVYEKVFFKEKIEALKKSVSKCL